jgi:hypothetical protein
VTHTEEDDRQQGKFEIPHDELQKPGKNSSRWSSTIAYRSMLSLGARVSPELAQFLIFITAARKTRQKEEIVIPAMWCEMQAKVGSMGS